MSQKITPMLWFNGEAEQAAKFYTGIFENAKIHNTSRYGEGAPMPKGTAMVVSFEVEGQRLMALNGGPHFKFTEAISLVVNCADQVEVDSLWSKLTADGGAPGRCGWLKDKYGLSWQIVPAEMERLMSASTPAQSQRVMAAMMKMDKLDIAALKKAAEA